MAVTTAPFDYIKRQVDVRNTIEVSYEGTRICSHVRSYDSEQKYVTIEARMPLIISNTYNVMATASASGLTT